MDCVSHNVVPPGLDFNFFNAALEGAAIHDVGAAIVSFYFGVSGHIITAFVYHYYDHTRDYGGRGVGQRSDVTEGLALHHDRGYPLNYYRKPINYYTLAMPL
jgi:hypothetical protein